jgi:hypothetical protein
MIKRELLASREAESNDLHPSLSAKELMHVSIEGILISSIIGGDSPSFLISVNARKQPQ